jgi:hypothetical protein
MTEPKPKYESPPAAPCADRPWTPGFIWVPPAVPVEVAQRSARRQAFRAEANRLCADAMKVLLHRGEASGPALLGVLIALEDSEGSMYRIVAPGADVDDHRRLLAVLEKAEAELRERIRFGTEGGAIYTGPIPPEEFL